MIRSTRIPALVVASALFAAACSGNVVSLSVGECFDDWEGSLEGATQQISEVPLVDCALPHDNEVYSVSLMPAGDYPGDQAVEDWTINRCLDSFDPYVGMAYADSILDFGGLFPTQDSWAGGDLEVMCFLWHTAYIPMTGSMQGSGI
jgi:hypothetical protein